MSPFPLFGWFFDDSLLLGCQVVRKQDPAAGQLVLMHTSPPLPSPSPPTPLLVFFFLRPVVNS